MDKALAANIIIIALEIIGFCFTHCRDWAILIFYTLLSNLITLIASVCFVVCRDAAFTVPLRYLSTVMLTLTVLITLFVLVPMGMGLRGMMLSGHGLFHHTLCPAISITSYILWERHSSMWGLPVAVTILYGLALFYLNYVKAVDGPYPFFKVHEQSVKATVIWMAVFIVLIAALSFGIICLAQ